MAPHTHPRLKRFLPVLLLLLLITAVLASWWQAATAVTRPDQPAAPQAPPDVTLVEVYPNLRFSYVTDINNAGDDRLFVVEQGGVIRVMPDDPDITTAPVFLDIGSKVESGGERGLLGLAFHPDYDQNGYFYVNYTAPSPLRTVIARYTASSGDPNTADPNSELILLQVNQPYANHNAGDLYFGPDGYLYVGLGDGGSAGDPQNRAQDLGDLLGKMLRLDVDANAGLAPDCVAGGNYSIPADNPFVGQSGDVCDEIWALGIRNPWRFSFDRQTGDMFIGDVGQNAVEEIDFQPADSSGGENYGWDIMEGSDCYGSGSCNTAGLVLPIYEYDHDGRCSITGGFVYRGAIYPVLAGYYLYADYCSGEIWGLTPAGGDWTGALSNVLLADIGQVSTFGEGVDGELYVAGYGGNGRIYHITEAHPADPDLAITKTGPAQAAYSAPFSYTITVNNQGAGPATDLVITDTLPAAADYISSSDGGSFAGGAVTWMADDLAPGDELAVHVTISATETVTNQLYGVTAGGGFGATGSDSVTTEIVPPAPALAVTKSGPAVVQGADAVTYTLTVSNDGTDTAVNLTVTDTLPLNAVYVSGGALVGDDVVWNAPSLAPNNTLTFQFAVTSTAKLLRNDSYEVTAAGGYNAQGDETVFTLINPPQVFLPVVLKE